MSITLSHCFMYVTDQDEALDFYTGTVGLEVRTDASMEGFRWLTVGPPKQPDIELGLMAIGPPIPPADQDTVRDLVSKGSLGGVIFETDDCRAAFEQVRAKGAEVLQEPIEQPYGVIDCAFRDPSGNMIRFSERQPTR
jgi:catechol 2,3-dioxygenase-like lactoylglutathione lyase family enzyme